MNQLSRLVLISACLGLAQTLPAGAADMDQPIYVEDAPEYVPVEIGSGWYLRGDVSYAVITSADAPDFRSFNPTTNSYSQGSYGTSDLSARWAIGVGAGYRFTNWLRADVTVDRLSGAFDGERSYAVPCIDPATDATYTGTTCRAIDDASFTAYNMMLNGYADLGTFAGFTPYVGAGVGFSVVNWDSLSSSTYCVDGAAACPSYLAATNTHAGRSDLRFAYQLMAGVAYDISKNLKLDLGYRYRRIAGGSMYSWNTTDSAAGAAGVQASDNGFSTHEVNLGLRYELW